MGGSQSTRKLSVDNENTIQVSPEALERITQAASAPGTQQQSPQQPYEPPPTYYESRPQPNYASEEAYWSRRIDGLKRAHAMINSTMHVEYQKTMNEAQKLYNMATDEKFAGGLPPCQAEKAKVLQCYSDNPNKSLLCSVLVNQFNECVGKSRVAAITAS